MSTTWSMVYHWLHSQATDLALCQFAHVLQTGGLTQHNKPVKTSCVGFG